MSQTVLITGAATGIGRETAKRFAAEGYNVALHYNGSEAAAQSLMDELKARHISVMRAQADVRDAGAVRAMVDKVCRAFVRIDVLVNNAVQMEHPGPTGQLFEDVPLQNWETMLRSSLEGVTLTIQCAPPMMRKSGWGRMPRQKPDCRGSLVGCRWSLGRPAS